MTTPRKPVGQLVARIKDFAIYRGYPWPTNFPDGNRRMRLWMKWERHGLRRLPRFAKSRIDPFYFPVTAWKGASSQRRDGGTAA